MSWRLHGERTAIVGGLRALLLQALHPEAMRKFAQVSDYRSDPWGRLHRTAAYVTTVTYGTHAQADRAAAHVRRVHERVGVGDPEQMAWVHACLVDSFLAVSRAAGVELSDRDAARYVEEQVIAAQLVGVPEERIVRGPKELDRFFSEIRPQLRATREARAAARYLLAPPMHLSCRYVVPARMGWTALASLAVGLLPDWARRLYWLPPLPGASLTTALTLHALHRTVAALPERYRRTPPYRAARARVHVAAAVS